MSSKNFPLVLVLFLLLVYFFWKLNFGCFQPEFLEHDKADGYKICCFLYLHEVLHKKVCQVLIPYILSLGYNKFEVLL